MTHSVFSLVGSVIMLVTILPDVNSYSDHSYTAAVFEFARQDNFSTPAEKIQNGLAYYRKAAEVANSKGADMIIFPEYGVFHPANRTVLKHFLEYTPNPKEIRTNPCNEYEQYSDRPILHALSCMAKDNSLVVVANVGDIKPCQNETGCPDDGDFHYNTNVAFDSDGTLIGRYHKERLFFEFGMDMPNAPEDPTFETKFGKFGMFICFDAVFERIAQVAKQDVEAILLTTMWNNPNPLMTSVQYWQSFAMGNNITFMVANIQMAGELAVGSGIFNGNNGPLAYTFNPDGLSKLVVAEVPRRHHHDSLPQTSESSITTITLNGTKSYENDGNKVPYQCSKKILKKAKDIYTDYRCLEENTANYTFVKLNRSEGHAQACNNGMCCSLQYAATDMEENYYLGVYNGTYDMINRYFWCQENCLLARCDAIGNNSCATFPLRSKTRFHHVHLIANFTTEHVYPSVLSSGMRLAPITDWQHGVSGSKKRYIAYDNPSGEALTIVGLNGRCYNRDPPYRR